MTLTEVLVVIAVVGFLVLAIFPFPEPPARKKAQLIQCIDNLKQIGIAYRLWPPGQSDKFPTEVSDKFGGAMEPASLGNVAAIFQVMSNELSTPKILVCPADTNRFAATNFMTGFDNFHISYFSGLDAEEASPERWLSGDSNLAVDRKPVQPGILNLSTNTSVTWTVGWHVNRGNIGLSDGSVQTVTISALTNLLRQTGLATNRLAIP